MTSEDHIKSAGREFTAVIHVYDNNRVGMKAVKPLRQDASCQQRTMTLGTSRHSYGSVSLWSDINASLVSFGQREIEREKKKKRNEEC